MPEITTAAADAVANYTPGQRDVLKQLRELQTQLSMSDAAFVREHLTLSSTTWSRLNSGTYSANAASAFVTLDGDLRQLRVKLATDHKITGNRPFYEFSQQQAVISAVTSCKLKPEDDPVRLVVFLSESGGGKTRLARELTVMHNGLMIEGRESWRKSYYAALCDIGAIAGVSADDLKRGEHSAEVGLIKKLKANRRVLIIDEGEYFGPRTINLVKLILNQTPTVVVLLAIPELFARWQRAAWEEAKQLNRRAEAIITDSKVTPDDVQLFFAGRVTLHEAGAVCAMIAKAANEFGRYGMVERIVDQLVAEEHERVGTEQAQHAVRCAKRLLNRGE
jgi:DNA transposition AAA+ family ATPase